MEGSNTGRLTNDVNGDMDSTLITLYNGHTTELTANDEQDPTDLDATRDDSKPSVADERIDDCRTRFSLTLDLSRLMLTALPDKLLDLNQIEYLYLEGNQISSLPEDFFGIFSRLKWLDLRRNQLQSIPCIYLGSHQCLRTILLEDNQLQTLPLELGNVQTLDGLNIRNNPLDFPPAEIINKGTKKILSFFRRLLKARSEGKDSHSASSILSDSDFSLSEETATELVNGSATAAYKSRKGKSSLQRKAATAPSGSGDGTLSAVSSATNMKREKKYLSQSDKYLKQGEEGVSESKINATYMEERRLARIRNRKMKQDAVIQGRRDQEMVKNWRDEAKQLQAQKLAERRLNGGFIDFVEPVNSAPFGVSNTDIRVLSNAERLKRNAKPVRKSDTVVRPISPETRLQVEDLKFQKERVLLERIRQHAANIDSRQKKTSSDPMQDMKAAQQELQMALELQKEVQQRRKELDYRFTAHPSDYMLPSHASSLMK